MKTKPKNFIEQIIEEDLKAGLSKSELKFRFPPEPNGYLHVGHTKAIGLNFGLGKKYGASVNLRFDDTNPTKEDQEYVDAIKEILAGSDISGIKNATHQIILTNFISGLFY